MGTYATWNREEHEGAERHEDDNSDHQKTIASPQRGHGKIHHTHAPASCHPLPLHIKHNIYTVDSSPST